ncbi:hypothetical protein KGA66_01005 [Actinocrinis puniceicyclus]|uniref:Uncharacterized protein n=1 Tax=Actinocrinis puniceicyclus TaxID=977794 RepID=A0A8J7WLC3_9ACTN|nr:hypothetical protein [Actinocrinis puniceicyclus]MBS2961605.1 hypothetical protein [Actinocrinis puniceicyclus]
MSETTPSAPPSLNGTQPTPVQVRAAAEALKSAIDRHLAAVEARSDELDPAVLEAFDALAAAAEEYDELLYTVHDEVTPFDVVPPESDAVYTGPEQVEAFSVYIRRDFLVSDPEALAAAAAGVAEDFTPLAGDNRAAIAELFDAFDADEISYRADELGLEAVEATTWVVATEPEVAGGWDDDPFSEVDVQRLLYRVDLVDEDELDEEAPDEEAEDEIGLLDEDADGIQDEGDGGAAPGRGTRIIR